MDYDTAFKAYRPTTSAAPKKAPAALKKVVTNPGPATAKPKPQMNDYLAWVEDQLNSASGNAAAPSRDQAEYLAWVEAQVLGSGGSAAADAVQQRKSSSGRGLSATSASSAEKAAKGPAAFPQPLPQMSFTQPKTSRPSSKGTFSKAVRVTRGNLTFEEEFEEVDGSAGPGIAAAEIDWVSVSGLAPAVQVELTFAVAAPERLLADCSFGT